MGIIKEKWPTNLMNLCKPTFILIRTKKFFYYKFAICGLMYKGRNKRILQLAICNRHRSLIPDKFQVFIQTSNSQYSFSLVS